MVQQLDVDVPRDTVQLPTNGSEVEHGRVDVFDGVNVLARHRREMPQLGWSILRVRADQVVGKLVERRQVLIQVRVRRPEADANVDARLASEHFECFVQRVVCRTSNQGYCELQALVVDSAAFRRFPVRLPAP
jgi:hypothetical protein